MLKKTVNLVALMMLVSTNVLSPFSYAGEIWAVSEETIDANLQTENFYETQSWNTQDSSAKPQNDEKDSQSDGIVVPLWERGYGEAEGIFRNEEEKILSPSDSSFTKEQSEEETPMDSHVADAPQNDEWDAQALIWEILTWEVEELTWIALELSQARETLNSDPIQKSETYNKVTVNVLAPVNTFPENTKLVIETVKWTQLEEVRQQISEESTNNVDEDAEIVAFDIRFEYELSDGSKVELQPKENTVQVTFDYSENKELKKAENDENQQIEIYHINDKDEEWNKVSTWAEIVEKIEINEQKSDKVENWLVIDAESFSYYTIVVQRREEASESAPTQTWQYGEDYDIISIARPSGLSSADFQIEWFTIMDRNLWASVAWTTCDTTTNMWACGYLYQRWNNYGFPISANASSILTNDGLTWDNSYNNNGYVSKSFINGGIFDYDVWSDRTHHDWVWWWANDVNYASIKNSNWLYWDDGWDRNLRQWPCPEWWHVPSAWEWSMLVNYWYYTNYSAHPSLSSNLYYFSDSTKREAFMNYFNIPFAGRRDYSDASLYGQGFIGSYWSSSPDSVSSPDSASSNYTRLLSLDSYVDTSDYLSRAYGRSVRCFKDSYVAPKTYTLEFEPNNGEEATTMQVVEWETATEPSPAPTKDGYTFVGWYSDEELTQAFDFSIAITGDITLYTKWEACPVWQSVVDNKCVNLWITYQDNVTTYVDALWNEFEMWSITASNWEYTITLLDRNLWATATWWEEAYGYHFQWWNNYGFDPNKNIKTITSKVDASDYYRYNPYSSDSFYTNSNSSASAWDSSNNNNLWWWINQWEPSIWYRMQWPCPAWYHVPSADEWATLLEIYHDLDDRWSSLDWNYPAYEVEHKAFRKGFQDTFYIALAWFRDNNASLANQWSVARLWTSTPYDDGEGKQSRRFYLDKNRVDLSWVKMQRLNGYSVRCFLNTDDADTVVLSFDTRGWNNIPSKTIQRWDSYEIDITPTKKDDKFVGWYIDENLAQPCVDQSFDEDTTLYAKYRSDLIIHEKNVTTYTDTQWKVFNMWTFTIDVEWQKITLLDRNLWATSLNWEDAYGYYFQWWNNYGFPWYNNVAVDYNGSIDASNYAWNNPYVSNKFIAWSSYWDDSYNTDLWWDSTDMQAARQWPCPAWFHIPTLDEWNDLIDAYASYSEDSYGSSAFREWFQDAFKIPLAGRMRYSNGNIENEWSHARIWASDSNGGTAWRFYLWWNTVDINNNSEKAYGYQVRCFKNDDTDTITLTYEVNGWTKMQAQTLSKWDMWYLPWYQTIKNWDELKWWYSDKVMTQEFDFDLPLTQDTTIYAKWTLSHVVTFVDRDGSILKTEIVEDWWDATAPQFSTRWWYEFKWWDKIFTNVTDDIEVKAQYGEITNYSGWWGGSWWGGWSSKPDTPKEEEKSIETSEKPSQNESQHWSSPDIQNYDQDTQDSTYSVEYQEAYKFARENGITSKLTIESAQMNWKLTRIAMAKMLSQYAINVLWKTLDTSKTIKFNDVTDKRNRDYDNWVTLAYQLWIMWQNMKDNNFRPDDEVSRAEFATALSRLLYSISDGEYKNTSKYYIHHMEKLKKEWIITKDDPRMKEKRWYVMIMLMRSVK